MLGRRGGLEKDSRTFRFSFEIPLDRKTIIVTVHTPVPSLQTLSHCPSTTLVDSGSTVPRVRAPHMCKPGQSQEPKRKRERLGQGPGCLSPVPALEPIPWKIVVTVLWRDKLSKLDRLDAACRWVACTRYCPTWSVLWERLWDQIDKSPLRYCRERGMSSDRRWNYYYIINLGHGQEW